MVATQAHIIIQIDTTEVIRITSNILNCMECQHIAVLTNGWASLTYFQGFKTTDVVITTAVCLVVGLSLMI